MRLRIVTVTAAMIAAGGLAAVVPAQAAPPGEPGAERGPSRAKGLEVYVGSTDAAGLEALRQVGLDHEDVSTGRTRDGKVAVEVVMNGKQAAEAAEKGVTLRVKRVNGRTASSQARRLNAAGYNVFRSYSEDGGIADQMRAAVEANPRTSELVRWGTTLKGQPMYAVRVTRRPDRNEQGSRPAVMYLGAQHAREWITPEMVRRLMLHYLDNYGTNARITRLVNTSELWFVPVANPDGYDYTFTEGNRLWRKNLSDNNDNGTTDSADGVDLNRNFRYKWGWDNEGSSPQPADQTYRGPGPNSEPETKALNRLFRRIGFEHFVNYHSAAELLLYGIGWQVNTPSPDDLIYEAMAGTDDDPAVPGYDPDISAELYTTNGDTDTHMTVRYGTLGFTPEMTTCEVASDIDPDDEWVADDCLSGFNFPDDEELVQAEFAKNIPFALSVADSADDPSDPVTFDGRQAPEMVADEFAVSHGLEQPVAVTADRDLRNLQVRWKVNGGPTRTSPVEEWDGGERYGDTHDDYYAEYRADVLASAPGDEVEVWFRGRKPGVGRLSTTPFTYTVADDIGGDVLVLAAEDYTGASPAQGVSAPKYAAAHVDAVEAAGYSADVYDIDANDRTAPHPLGVLGHYDAVVWESGDDIIPREDGQPAGSADDETVKTELAVRDYLNEGGKALVAGQYNRFAEGTDGLYAYNPFAPPECTNVDDPQPVGNCLPLLNDFQQYWLGAYLYVSDGGTDPDGNPYPVEGNAGSFDGFEGELNAPGSAENQAHTASFLNTSSFLPVDEFPQFTSSIVADWVRPGGSPYDPRTGSWYVWSQQDDESWKRLTTTVDLRNATTGSISAWVSHDLETDYDYAFVEAHTVGEDDWTTLPDENGNTSQDTGDSCAINWNEVHPFLDRYQTDTGDTCTPTGTSGEWHAATGNSNGWRQWRIDLSDYAGERVEVSFAYASDFAVQGLGAFVDDAQVTVGNRTLRNSFETSLAPVRVSGPPPGSPPNDNDWTRVQSAFEEGAVVVTDDTAYAGFGAEGFAPADREDFIARGLEHLLD